MVREVTATEYVIDKITYIVTAYTSETATDTLHKKIDKLILRDMRRMAENLDNTGNID
jgi:hypothetical protein